MSNDKFQQYLQRTMSENFDPEKDIELLKDDAITYVRQLFKHGFYKKGIDYLAETLRGGALITDGTIDSANLRFILAELLDPKGHEFNFQLVPKKTDRHQKAMSKMNDEVELLIAVEKTMKRDGLSKNAAIEKIAPGRERQAYRQIAQVEKRNDALGPPMSQKPTDKNRS